ncbi:MAG TPA: hypothetical protein VD926_10765 [Acidimicrobiales bacterium]|nr:hypothetical protein [Acidimicrobiales bacterium]
MKLAAGVLGAALVVAACSSGDDGGSRSAVATTVSTTTTTPGPTPDELAAAVCAAQPAPGQARVADPELTELSGVVALDSGRWAHNDSGDSARLFQLAEDGSTQAVVPLDGVEATDWEDLSSAGPSSGELFVGDIGDNAGVRSEVLVHRVTVPDPPSDAALAQTITLRYPDGPRDAETLLVDPLTRDLVVVHKRFGGASEVYVAPEADWSDGEATLDRAGIVEVGDSPVDATTGGDVGHDGRVVALRTYLAVLVFPRQDDQSLAQALVENDPCDAPAAVETQGEALAFTEDGYVTIGEGERPAINRWTVTVEGDD